MELEYSFLHYLLTERPPADLLRSVRSELEFKNNDVKKIVDYICDNVPTEFPVPDMVTVDYMMGQKQENLDCMREAFNTDIVARDFADFEILFRHRSSKESVESLSGMIKRAIERGDTESAIKYAEEIATLGRQGRAKVGPVDMNDFFDIEELSKPEILLSTDFPQLNQHLGGWPGNIDYEDCGGFSLGELAVIGGSTNAGKGIRLTELLPTPDGFKLAKEVEVGDYLMGSNGKPTKVLMKSDIHNRPCYKIIFNDGTDIITDDEHNWSVYEQDTKGNSKFNDKLNTVTTKEMFDTGVVYNLGASKTNRSRYKIPLTSKVEYEIKELPIHPYILGYWLGDGSSSSARITIGIDDIEHFRCQANTLNFPINSKLYPGKSAYTVLLSDGNKSYSSKVNSIQSKLRNLNLLNNKHIPSIYLTSSIEQRIALLRGLLDSDGSAERCGAKFYNINETLIDNVVELVCSLGGVAYKHPKYTNCNGRKFQSFCLDIKIDINPFLLERKAYLWDNKLPRPYRFIRSIEEVESEPTICFMVDAEDSLYLASRNYIVTHNSTLSQTLLYGFVKKSDADSNYRSVYFNYESAYDRFKKTFFANVTGYYPSGRDSNFRMYKSATDEYNKFISTRKNNFLIYDGAGGEMPFSTVALELELSKKAEEGYKVFFIDTINSIDNRDNSESHHIAERAMRMLERVAKKYNVAIIATAQNKQTLQFEEDKWPELRWIGQSAALQQKCGVALGIYRADLYSGGTLDYTTIAIMKLRHRSIGIKEGVNVSYDVARRMYVPYKGQQTNILTSSESVQNRQIFSALKGDASTAFATV